VRGHIKANIPEPVPIAAVRLMPTAPWSAPLLPSQNPPPSGFWAGSVPASTGYVYVAAGDALVRDIPPQLLGFVIMLWLSVLPLGFGSLNVLGSNSVTALIAVPVYVSIVVVFIGDVADGISTLCLTSALVASINAPSEFVCIDTPVTVSAGSSTCLLVIDCPSTLVDPCATLVVYISAVKVINFALHIFFLKISLGLFLHVDVNFKFSIV